MRKLDKMPIKKTDIKIGNTKNTNIRPKQTDNNYNSLGSKYSQIEIDSYDSDSDIANSPSPDQITI